MSDRFEHIHVEIIDDIKTLSRFVCLEDTSVKTSKESMSITNQADDVVDWLNENHAHHAGEFQTHYLYKDTEGVVDELKTDESGKFMCFNILNGTTFHDAIMKLIIKKEGASYDNR